MPTDVQDATITEAGLTKVFADLEAKHSGELKAAIAPMTERAKAVDEALAAHGKQSEEFKTKLSEAGDAYDVLLEQVKAIEARINTEKAANSDDMPRARVAGNRYSDLTYEALETNMVELLVNQKFPMRQARIDEWNEAVNGSKFDRDDVERHFDLLDKRLASVGGLDPILKTARDIALGRKAGDLTWPAAGNMIYNGLDAALTSATDSGGAIIPTEWSAERWAEQRLMGENFLNAFQERVITGGPEKIPSFGSDAWGQMRAEAETGDRRDAAFTFHTTEATAHTLEARTLVVQDFIDDAVLDPEAVLREEFPRIFLDGMQQSIIRADKQTAAAQNVNLAAYVAPTPGSPQLPENIGFQGLIRYCLNDAAAATKDLNGAFSSGNAEDEMDNLRNLLDWGGFQPEDAIYIMGIKERQAIRRYATTYLTLQNVGAALATAIQGDLRRVAGMEIYTPRAMPGAFNDDGRIDPTEANNTKGAILIVNRYMATIVMRRMPAVQVYPAANMSPEGLYPGIKGRYGFIIPGYDPADATRRTNILRGDTRGVAMLYNITRPS